MNQKYKNIAKVKSIERKNEKILLSVNPKLDNGSGIYFLTRVDTETGIKFSYVGQALHIKQRMLQHMTGYQHIDLSIRKHKFFTEDNPGGWQVNFMHFPKEELDEMERYYITLYAKNGYQSRNKDTGGGAGKQELGERKPPRGYYDGVVQGKKMLAKELSHIMDKHLIVEIKPEKAGNKVSQKMFEKFKGLLEEGVDS
ncbi:hypothetical protein B5F53_11595 [Blautia sp. An249]|uniref:hypothetical protein n=1 Tax=Blautia sp. An249 TaxID=1965603 RepID=UPI000B38E3C1|nr:hypothetical protein [Blautia sp. An249]OUO78184.1 hypothetical protein B5F53_11595 [Blautia sp. An249]